jgi:hypothetical protein
MRTPDESEHQTRCEACKWVMPFPDATEADAEKAWGRVWKLYEGGRWWTLCKRCHPQGRYRCDWCGERFQGTVHEWVDWQRFETDDTLKRYWDATIDLKELAAWLDTNVGTARPASGVLIEKKQSGRTVVGMAFGLCTSCDPYTDPKRVLERKRQRDREAHQRQRDRQKPKPTKVCGVCGQTFTPKRSDAVYCSPKCRLDRFRAKAE